MKTLFLIITAAILLLSGCGTYAPMPSNVNYSSNSNMAQSGASLHEKYSQANADRLLKVGVDNALTVATKLGAATFESRTEDGDLVWGYQARSSVVNTNAQVATNAQAGLFNASAATASNVNTEATKKVTTLRVVFDANGYVKDYYSELLYD